MADRLGRNQCTEAPWVPFRVSARRIGVRPRSSVRAVWSRRAQGLRPPGPRGRPQSGGD